MLGVTERTIQRDWAKAKECCTRSSAHEATTRTSSSVPRRNSPHRSSPTPTMTPLGDDVIAALRTGLGDRYQVEREIGRGGMATVYLAHDVKHGRPVALKVLHPDLTPALGADRFVREVQTIAGLRHPHILPLYDSGEVDGYLYYVMPFIGGESLRGRLTRERTTSAGRHARHRGSRSPTPSRTPPQRRHSPGHQAREHPARRGTRHPRRLRDRARHPRRAVGRA